MPRDRLSFVKQKALLISFAFPPIAEAESYLVAKSLSSLKNFEVDILTLEPNDFLHRIDHTLDAYILQGFSEVVRCPVNYDIRMRIRGKFPFLSETPDLYKGYIHKINRIALEMFQNKKYDAVISWSNWLTSHLPALYLKKKYPDLKWLAHLSDPWMGNPYIPRQGLTRYINQKLQNKVFESADALVFTSEIAINFSKNHTDIDIDKKSYSVPHCYDKSFYGAASPTKSEKKVFRYIGNFYGHRTPHYLFEALLQLNPSLLEKISIEFIGSTPDQIYNDGAYKNLPKGLVRQLKPVSYFESLKAMQEADFLLLIDAPAQESIFLPSKLIDYIGAEKPILGLTPAGVARNVLNEFGYSSAEPDNVEAISSLFEKFIREEVLDNGNNQRTLFDVKTIRYAYNDLLKTLAN